MQPNSQPCCAYMNMCLLRVISRIPQRHMPSMLKALLLNCAVTTAVRLLVLTVTFALCMIWQFCQISVPQKPSYKCLSNKLMWCFDQTKLILLTFMSQVKWTTHMLSTYTVSTILSCRNTGVRSNTECLPRYFLWVMMSAKIFSVSHDASFY